MSTRLTSWRIYFAIGLGGMVGAVGRYSISVFLDNRYLFPIETLTANLIGCFLLSFLLNSVWFNKKLSRSVSTGLTTGVIGAFTTFSTYAVETVELGYQHISLAIAYVLISIIGGLLLCYLGYKLAKKEPETI